MLFIQSFESFLIVAASVLTTALVSCVAYNMYKVKAVLKEQKNF